MSGFPTFAAPLDPVNVPVRRCSAGRNEARERILIVRTIAHGDIVMASPLLAALRAARPDAHLTWLVERTGRESVDASPFVDELLLWDTPYWKQMTRRGLFPLFFLRVWALRRMLRAWGRPFDTLISLQPEDWPWLVGCVGAPRSVGVFDTFRRYHRQTRTSRRARLYSDVFTHDDLPPHRTDQYLLPLRTLGLPAPPDCPTHIGYTNEDARAADAFLARHDLSPRFITIAPMTGWPSRCWPGERYAALADALAREHGCSVVLVGGAHERAEIEAVAARMTTHPVVAAGAFGFRALAALLARASLLVSGDTGPMHVAAAVGTPFLALFGPTPVEGRAPRNGKGVALFHAVPCGPCDQKRCPLPAGDDHLRCLRLITLDEARTAAGRLMGGRVPVPAVS